MQPAMLEPAIAVPDQWYSSERATVATDVAEYWRLLGDPVLTSYVEAALAGNRDLALGAARLDQAGAQLAQARAAYLPSINASGGVQQDFGDFARNRPQFSVGADASWEADLFGRIGGNAAAAQADLAAAGYSLADLQRLITGQVALSVISARSLSLQLDTARETLAFQDNNLQIARWRNQAGLVSSLDVEQARAQRAQTAATIPALESSLAATANSISTLVGEAPGAVLVQLAPAAAIPVPPGLAGIAPPAEVLRRRPDVRSAEQSLLASTARIGVARAQLLPLVRLSGTVSTAAANPANLFDIITGGLFGSVSQLIFDGGRTAAQIDGAEASARAALAVWEQNILAALEEVESAEAARRAADQRITINLEAVDAAGNSVLLARNQYQAGLTDFRNLLTAENQLLSARNQLLVAQADRASAFVRLTQALGGGWAADASGTAGSNGPATRNRDE